MTEALKLAKILENIEGYRATLTAAHELRRLHEENKKLKEALAQPAQEQEQEQEPVDYKKLAALGWQAVECQICGFSAQAFPKPEQEPVAWRFTGIAGLNRYMTQKKYDAQTPEIKKWYEPFKCANCITLPQRTWVGLTDEEQQQAYEQWQNDGWGVFYNAIEAKLKEKNG